MMVSTGPPEAFNNNASSTSAAAAHLLCCAESDKAAAEPKAARQAAASPQAASSDELSQTSNDADDKKSELEQASCHGAKSAQRQGSPAPQPPLPIRDCKYVDIYREKPIRVIVKVLVPVREHPKFNFVGKLLGPKGNSMKRLQEETMTKMAVLGRGSMRDKQKEEELRASMDPKYCHLGEELHVEITAYAPPAEAHARIAYALAEVRKYLIPDSNDEIRQEQMREMELLQNTLGGGDDSSGANGANSSSASSPSPVTSPPVSSVGPMPGRRLPLGMRGGRGGRGGLPPPPILRGPMPPGRGGRGSLLPPPLAGGRGPHPLRKAPLPPPSGPNMLVRPSPKQKVMSILDRARVAMEESYQYEECYYNAYDPVGYGGYDEYDDNLGDYYEPADGYTDGAAGGHWKSFKAPPTNGPGADRTRFRTVPYARPK